MIKPRFRAAVAASAVLLTTLAGCGGTEQPNAGTASRTTTPETPAESSDSGAAVALNKDNFVATLVDAMRTKKTAHMEMEMGTTVAVSADVRYAAGDKLDATEMAMTMTMGSMEQRLIMVDGAVYMSQPGGNKFLKIDADDPMLAGALSQADSIGPEASVKGMEGAIQTVEDKGTETVDGAKLRRYQVTLDSSKMAGTLDDLGSTAGELPATLTYDMWLDADNLMRRLEMDVLGEKIVMVMSRWGEPVDIKAPPADQLVQQ